MSKTKCLTSIMIALCHMKRVSYAFDMSISTTSNSGTSFLNQLNCSANYLFSHFGIFWASSCVLSKFTIKYKVRKLHFSRNWDTLLNLNAVYFHECYVCPNISIFSKVVEMRLIFFSKIINVGSSLNCLGCFFKQ